MNPVRPFWVYRDGIGSNSICEKFFEKGGLTE